MDCTLILDFAYDCDGNCLNDSDGDGTCDELEVLDAPISIHQILIHMQQKMMGHVW